MTMSVIFRIAAPLIAALLFNSARADDGHDHGAAPQTSGPALPRFTATSDQFELVGVVNGKLLTLYLDEAASNAPVKNAKLDIELGGAMLAVQAHGEGEFEATLVKELSAGVTTVTATVTTATETDLLAGEIDVHEAAHAEAAPARNWMALAPWAGGGVLVLLAAWWLARRVRSGRQRGDSAAMRVGGAA